MSKATEGFRHVIPFLVALNTRGRAEQSIPAVEQGPQGPTADQWKGDKGATGAHWLQGTGSHRSRRAPSMEERQGCIWHLRDENR